MKNTFIIFLLMRCIQTLSAGQYEDAITTLQKQIKATREQLSLQSDEIYKQRSELVRSIDELKENCLKTKALIDKTNEDINGLIRKRESLKKVIERRHTLEREIDVLKVYFKNLLLPSERNAFTKEQESNFSFIRNVAYVHIKRSGGWSYYGQCAGVDGKILKGRFTQYGPVTLFCSPYETGLVDESGSIPVISQVLKVTNDRVELRTEQIDGEIVAAPSLIDSLRGGGKIVIILAVMGTLCAVAGVISFIHMFNLRFSSWDKLVGQNITGCRTSRDDACYKKMAAPLRSLIEAARVNSGLQRDQLEDKMCGEIHTLISSFERLLPVLSTCAVVAPMLGLLGTVSGMIESFAGMSLTGAAKADVLSGGISEALITTEWGLCVAVPALVIHACLSRMNKKLLSTMQLVAGKLIDAFAVEESCDE